jgi:hypothetical protein
LVSECKINTSALVWSQLALHASRHKSSNPFSSENCYLYVFTTKNRQYMSTVEMRTEVHKMIDEIDDALLAAVHALLGAYKQQQKEAVIGYEVDGTPITAAAFLERADELMAEVERGEYVTLEELEQESESWLKRTK